MNCLVVSATILEIKPFIEHCRISDKLDYIDLELDFLITGVGYNQYNLRFNETSADKKA